MVTFFQGSVVECIEISYYEGLEYIDDTYSFFLNQSSFDDFEHYVLELQASFFGVWS